MASYALSEETSQVAVLGWISIGQAGRWRDCLLRDYESLVNQVLGETGGSPNSPSLGAHFELVALPAAMVNIEASPEVL